MTLQRDDDQHNGSAMAGCLISFFLLAAVIAVSVLLTGCAEWGAIKSGVSVHGARLADEQLITARWMSCEAATVGAIRRKYKDDPVGMRAWQDFCSLKAEQAITP